MPALKVFGRRWLVAGDDVPGPAVVLATFHLVWVALLIAWLGEIHGPEDCQGVGPYYTAVGGLLLSFLLSCILEIAATIIGLRGSLFETQKRAALPKIIYANTLCYIAQIAFNAYATYLITRRPPQCSKAGGELWDPVDVLGGVVISTWIVILGLCGFIVAAYNLFPDYKNPQEWERQCECLAVTCCCSGWGGRNTLHNSASKRLGTLFALMFSHIDFTPSDIVAAFGLALNKQRLRRRAMLNLLSKSKRRREERPAMVMGNAMSGAVEGIREESGGGLPAVVGDSSPASVDGLLDDIMERGTAVSGIGNSTGEQYGEDYDAFEIESSVDSLDLPPGFFSTNTNASNRGGFDGINGASGSGLMQPANGGNGNGGSASEAQSNASESVAIGGVSSSTSRFPGLVNRSSSRNLDRRGGESAEMRDELEAELEAMQRKQLMELGPVDAATLSDAAYYMKYALAVYGWMLFVFERKTYGIAQLCFGRSCGLWTSMFTGGSARGRPPFPSTDGRVTNTTPSGRLFDGVPRAQAPMLDREAIIQASEVSEEDLLDVRLENEVTNVLPYFIAVDHGKKAVVVAIRGSLSWDDVIRDLLFDPADIDDWVQDPRVIISTNSSTGSVATGWDAPLPPLRPASGSTRFAAHSGIMEASKATLEDIQASGALARLLLGPDSRCHGYRLIMCGHSLGAGCAFLISLRLRQFFPNLHCYTYSPPGGLVTEELAAGSQDWCTAVVCGKEMIPRLTLSTFERIRDDMVHCAARCRRPKLSLFMGWLTGRIWSEKELFYTPESLPEEPKAWLDEYRASLASTAASRHWMELCGKFGPPGKVMYLKPTGRKAVKRSGLFKLSKTVVRDYRAVWVDSTVLVDQGVTLSGRMMLDHFPDYCYAVLRRLASAGGGGVAAHVSDAAGESDVKAKMHIPSVSSPSTTSAAGAGGS